MVTEKFENNPEDITTPFEIVEYESVSETISDHIKTLDNKDHVISSEFKKKLQNFITNKKILAKGNKGSVANEDLKSLNELNFKLNSLAEGEIIDIETGDINLDERSGFEGQIFTINPNESFSEIDSDINFNKWMLNMETFLHKVYTNISPEIKDLKDWYREYQETLPYIDKLNTVFSDIEKSTIDIIELHVAKSKVDLLICKIHTEGEVVKKEIDTIFESYIYKKTQEKKLESLKKTEALKAVIREDVYSTGITPDQTKEILESRGEENTMKNVNELIDFLEDTHENYDFYYSGIKTEDQGNNVRRGYERYKHIGRKNLEPEKANFVDRSISSVLAYLSINIDNSDKFNHFIGMTQSIREFDLVDRKNGNETQTNNNKQKMYDLINFCKNNKEILVKCLTNKNNITLSEIESDPENKKLSEIMFSLYKKFTQGKYQTPDAKAEAKKILDETSDFTESTLTSKSTLEILYSITPSEMQKFETKAKLFVNKKILTEIELEIKTKITKNELSKIEFLFNSVKSVLEELGTNEDKNRLEIFKLNLSIVNLKNIDKENLKELSDSFSTYDSILSSEIITKEVKIEHITTLITNLEKHHSVKENSALLNARLDAIIKLYKEKLKSIK